MSLIRYNTRRQLEFFILAHREAIRLFPLQILKHQVNGIPEILVVLACLHTADHINQRRKVAIFLQRFLPQIADQRRVEQHFRFLPKWIAALALAARIGNQAIYQFQDILFAMDIRQRIIVHALGKIDRVHHLNAVAEMPQHPAALDDQTAFRVGHNERAGVFFRHALHEIWFDEESRLAAARTADDQDVFVPRRPGVFGAAVHGQPFRLRQQDVVFENGVDKRLDVLARSP